MMTTEKADAHGALTDMHDKRGAMIMTIVGQAGRHKRGEDVAPKMTETTVPKWGPEGSNQGMCSWQTKRVQRAGAIAPDDHVLR